MLIPDRNKHEFPEFLPTPLALEGNRVPRSVTWTENQSMEDAITKALRSIIREEIEAAKADSVKSGSRVHSAPSALHRPDPFKASSALRFGFRFRNYWDRPYCAATGQSKGSLAASPTLLRYLITIP